HRLAEERAAQAGDAVAAAAEPDGPAGAAARHVEAGVGRGRVEGRRPGGSRVDEVGDAGHVALGEVLGIAGRLDRLADDRLGDRREDAQRAPGRVLGQPDGVGDVDLDRGLDVDDVVAVVARADGAVVTAAAPTALIAGPALVALGAVVV